MDGDEKYEWAGAQGATEAEIRDLAMRLSRPLPEAYVAFLRLANGAEVRYSRLWDVVLYPTSEVTEVWRLYQFDPELFPGAVLFGSNGGDELLVFDMRPEQPDGRYPVYVTYNLDVNWEDATVVAEDFRGLLLLRKSLLHGLQLSRAGLSGSQCAKLLVPLTCPACGSLADPYEPEMRLQWGRCGFLQGSHVPRYQLGDTLQWQRAADGTILPWADFLTSDAHWFNFGDPLVSHLITRDVWHFGAPPPLQPHPLACPSCGQVLAGAAIEIRDGVIRRAWTYTADGPDALDNTATDYLVQPDGTLLPMADWVDHAIAVVEETDAEDSSGDS